MIKIAVCDDEPLELSAIGSILTDYLQKHPEMDLEFTLFQSSEQLISHIPNEFFHVYLLDIVMDGKNGIEAGDLIHRRYPQALLIYLTSSPDYAIASYTVNAYYYLLKPLEEEKLIPVLERAVADCKEQDNYQLIRTKTGAVTVLNRQIMYVEYMNHILVYHLLDGSSISSLTFRCSFDEAAKELLSSPGFVKVSSSFLVNLACVKELTAKGFLMPGGVELTVTRSYSEAKHQFLELMLGRVRHDI